MFPLLRPSRPIASSNQMEAIRDGSFNFSPVSDRNDVFFPAVNQGNSEKCECCFAEVEPAITNSSLFFILRMP